MLHVSMSTLACPADTLRDACAMARGWDFDGIELRTFGPGSAHLASDPCLSDPLKVRRIVGEHGLALTGYGSSARFDEQVTPPLPVGFIFGDPERPVREFKATLSHASHAGAGYVRVFGFERPHGEPYKRVVKRIGDRLKLVCDDARHQNVRVAIENGGDFASAEALSDILDRVRSPHMGVCYNLGCGTDAGDAPEAASGFGDTLLAARLTDRRGTAPCAAGAGDLPAEAFVKSLDAMGRGLPLVLEWPVMWRDDIAAADEVLPASFAAVSSWCGAAEPVGV